MLLNLSIGLFHVILLCLAAFIPHWVAGDERSPLRKKEVKKTASRKVGGILFAIMTAEILVLTIGMSNFLPDSASIVLIIGMICLLYAGVLAFNSEKKLKTTLLFLVGVVVLPAFIVGGAYVLLTYTAAYLYGMVVLLLGFIVFTKVDDTSPRTPKMLM